MKRQLQLPGTLRRPAPPPPRARDLSAAAFERALARNGFSATGPGGLLFADTRCWRGQYVEAVCRVNPIRIARRATLAKLVLVPFDPHWSLLK